MKRQLESLTDHEHDVLVIGGGITGAFLALDAATRGARVALIDKADFGGATSASSSKLLHGGLRYLQQLRFGKARESAQERLLFQNLVPHLVHYVPFVVPTYRSLAKSRTVLATGMRVYETLCIGQRHLLLDPSRAVPEGRGLDADEVRALVPGLGTDVTGGRLFYESHMVSSERVTLAVVDGAAEHGATVANYVEAVDFLRSGDTVQGVRARDVEDGRELEIRARLTINAAGPWIRALDERLGAASGQPLTGFSRGAHIVTRPLTEGHAVALPTQRRADTVIDRGGRHVFVIPWRGHSLIGTSYGPHEGRLDDVRPTAAEIDALIADINGALGPGTLSRDDVRYAFAGLYPLTADEIDPDKYQGSSDYVVVDHAAAGVDGVATVFGAKFTTARLLAERALDRLLDKVEGDWGSGRTRTMALPVAPDRPLADGIEAGSFERDLATQHGARAPAVAALTHDDPTLREGLGDGARGVRAVDVVWAAREEMALHLDDVVFRRTGLGTLGHPGETALRRAASLLAAERDWSEARVAAEIERVETYFAW